MPMLAALTAFLIIPLNCGIWWIMIFGTSSSDARSSWLGLFLLLAFGQFVAGFVAVVSGIRQRKKLATFFGAVLGLGGAVGGLIGAALASLPGPGGRPLRVRGRAMHADLRAGADWTRGEAPDPSQLDAPTRRALEALWLHTAQLEHASVPAFSRLSWFLAAVGAPAELLELSHRAALDEIEHARLCFALAAGHAGRTHGVEAMPQLLTAGLDLKGDPLEVLARESVIDGCQLEGFGADVAEVSARACQEGATRRALVRIAADERTHAELSWKIVEWLLEAHTARVAPALESALSELAEQQRPIAISWDKRSLVAAADPDALRAHGQLSDEEWGALWHLRLDATRSRLSLLLQCRATLPRVSSPRSSFTGVILS
jgi:hypothetical protein